MDDDKASHSVVFEILQNVITGQTTAEQTGNRAENTSVYCGKTKVFLANSVVRVLFSWLTVPESTRLIGIPAEITVQAILLLIPA